MKYFTTWSLLLSFFILLEVAVDDEMRYYLEGKESEALNDHVDVD